MTSAKVLIQAIGGVFLRYQLSGFKLLYERFRHIERRRDLFL